MIYVDDMRRSANLTGRTAKWSHLMADTPEELAEFAAWLGLDPSWLQHPGTHREHYDVTETNRLRALTAGAEPITYPHGTGELMRRKRAAMQPTPAAEEDAAEVEASRTELGATMERTDSERG